MENLENIPALFYSAFWSTREMDFLKRVLMDLKIDKLKILIFMQDYLPGALITLDGQKGDYLIESIENIETVVYDGAFISNIKDMINLLQGNMILKGIFYLMTRKIKMKGISSLLKFLNLLGRLAL